MLNAILDFLRWLAMFVWYVILALWEAVYDIVSLPFRLFLGAFRLLGAIGAAILAALGGVLTWLQNHAGQIAHAIGIYLMFFAGSILFTFLSAIPILIGVAWGSNWTILAGGLWACLGITIVWALIAPIVVAGRTLRWTAVNFAALVQWFIDQLVRILDATFGAFGRGVRRLGGGTI